MNYPKDFASFWNTFSEYSPSQKGSKYEAFQVWQDMSQKNQLDDLAEILHGIVKHSNNDKFFKTKNQFVASWKHGCRWLRNRSWEIDDERELVRDRAVRARQKEIEKRQSEARELERKRKEASEASFDWDASDNPLARAMKRKGGSDE